MVTDSEVVDTKSGTGKLLKMKNEVDGGPYHGRIVWDQLNIANASPEAQSIGLRQLADLFIATGAMKSNRSDVLHFKPYMGDVRIEAREGYEPRNVIKKYKPIAPGAAAPSRPAARTGASPAPAAQSRPAAPGGRPWPVNSAQARDDANKAPF